MTVATMLAAAAPAATQPEVPPAAPPAAAVLAKNTVTLVTGDVVDLTTLSNGDATATVRPASDRHNVSYATRKVGEALYAIPSDAMSLLAAGKLDEELFNVRALVDSGYDDGGTWTKVDLVSLNNGTVRAIVHHPAVANTSGAVSLRVKATDVAGNSIDQTLIRAYGLTSVD
ncbi:hypothetical protein [Micromonospora sp. NPDC007230]|uniref:hypothetical protein n=1 Tax=Micromonospora sp. NPDC007230 TaxID=3364237 RepID=UPI00369FACFA